MLHYRLQIFWVNTLMLLLLSWHLLIGIKRGGHWHFSASNWLVWRWSTLFYSFATYRFPSVGNALTVLIVLKQCVPCFFLHCAKESWLAHLLKKKPFANKTRANKCVHISQKRIVLEAVASAFFEAVNAEICRRFQSQIVFFWSWFMHEHRRREVIIFSRSKSSLKSHTKSG